MQRLSPLRALAISQFNPTANVEKSSTLLAQFLGSYRELESYKNGKAVSVDGSTLSIAAVTAAARYGASVVLDDSPDVKERVLKSRAVIAAKVDAGTSIYGVSTGFGGSADTRTDDSLALGNALLQHQHSGILPSSTTKALTTLPLLDPIASTSMPESWVKGAILIRMNSLIRGHSGVRWELIETMGTLLRENITPLVPLRGSISASGDLSPLSYIAGTLIGNPSIRVFDGPTRFGARQVVPSINALNAHGIVPLGLKSKEHLGILNGTAFSASVASLVLNDAVHLALLAQVLTAMGTEALVGSRGSYDPFIHEVARPHPGQVEAASTIHSLLEGSKFASLEEREVSIEDDHGTLRQDRYPLRTSPQFLGPQLEDILASCATITQECNSTTDNPLINGETGQVHNGGNFQAMAVTNSMEKTRLSLHHIGKLLFSQCAELVNPAMNHGLPPSLAATDPSLNYHCKGIDIGTAAYVSELGYLASPVSTHIQAAEMNNQAVNSLALISARATVDSLEVLSILSASYLYTLCQALDLRALQFEFLAGLKVIVQEEVSETFGEHISQKQLMVLTRRVSGAMRKSFEATSTMDVKERMDEVAASSSTILFDLLIENAPSALAHIPGFRSNVSSRAALLLDELRRAYLSGEKGHAPASPFLNKSRPIYEYVRLTLGIRMHGSENYTRFAQGLGVEDITVGGNVSLIHESIRDGELQGVVAAMFA